MIILPMAFQFHHLHQCWIKDYDHDITQQLLSNKPINPADPLGVESSIATDISGEIARRCAGTVEWSRNPPRITPLKSSWNWSIVDASPGGGELWRRPSQTPHNYSTGIVARNSPPSNRAVPRAAATSHRQHRYDGNIKLYQYSSRSAVFPPANLYAVPVVRGWVNVTIKDIHGIGVSNLSVNSYCGSTTSSGI